MADGWYYLHTNGALIYKRELGGTAADIRESPFAVMLWPCDPADRETAWRILVEAAALSATPEDIARLAARWGCDDEDAQVYAKRVGVGLFRDGDQWCAVRGADFVDIQQSAAGFGDTCLQAMGALCKALGYVPAKMWGATFPQLLAGETRAATPICPACDGEGRVPAGPLLTCRETGGQYYETTEPCRTCGATGRIDE